LANRIKIGIIGLDTSHVTAFTELLSQPSHPYHVPGGQVIAAYPGGSPDFELSISRVPEYTAALREDYSVAIVDSIDEAAQQSDAILLESVDGRAHLAQFARLASFGKPVFIDKPLAVTLADAAEIARLAALHRVPIFTSSALRFAEAFKEALADQEQGGIRGIDAFGPMAWQPTQPGYFWYGIHTVEMAFAAMGADCLDVTVASNEKHDILVGRWSDDRLVTIRGNRTGNTAFGAILHREKGSRLVDIRANPKPYYVSLLEQIVRFFEGGESPVSIDESLQVIRFIEAANESRATGKTVKLQGAGIAPLI